MLPGGLPSAYPLRRLFRESFPFYIDNYLWYLKGDGDTLLVAFLGPAVLAEYYIAKSLYTNVLIGWYALDKVVLERLARFGQMSDGFRARAAEIHVRVSETAVPAMMLVIALAPYGLLVLAGAKYADATWPAVALLGVALIQFMGIAINRAVFVGLPGTYRLSTSAVEAAAVLIAAACLVPAEGIMGVALARIVGPAAGAAFGYMVLREKFALSLPWQPTLCALAASAPGTAMILLLAPAAHGAATAVLDAAGAGVFWLSSFALLSYALNRAAFDAGTAFLLRRYRAVFSP
jgi:O-antigen/teichoic acid export membrane protein